MASPEWLTRTADLEAVRLQGKRNRTETLEVRHLASLLRHPRVGVIVPKHQQSAVARNLVKRRLRALARGVLFPALRSLPALDVVVRATPAAYRASFATLSSDLVRASSRLVAEATR